VQDIGWPQDHGEALTSRVTDAHDVFVLVVIFWARIVTVLHAAMSVVSQQRRNEMMQASTAKCLT
jgi:hypothetical protein